MQTNCFFGANISRAIRSQVHCIWQSFLVMSQAVSLFQAVFHSVIVIVWAEFEAPKLLGQVWKKVQF